jgi:hypothetical protein
MSPNSWVAQSIASWTLSVAPGDSVEHEASRRGGPDWWGESGGAGAGPGDIVSESSTLCTSTGATDFCFECVGARLHDREESWFRVCRASTSERANALRQIEQTKGFDPSSIQSCVSVGSAWHGAEGLYESARDVLGARLRKLWVSLALQAHRQNSLTHSA